MKDGREVVAAIEREIARQDGAWTAVQARLRAMGDEEIEVAGDLLEQIDRATRVQSFGALGASAVRG